jgi:hypothetical protein
LHLHQLLLRGEQLLLQRAVDLLLLLVKLHRLCVSWRQLGLLGLLRLLLLLLLLLRFLGLSGCCCCCCLLLQPLHHLRLGCLELP